MDWRSRARAAFPLTWLPATPTWEVRPSTFGLGPVLCMFDAAHPEFDLVLEKVTAISVEAAPALAPAPNPCPAPGTAAWLLEIVDALPSDAARIFAEQAVPFVLSRLAIR